MRVELKKFVDRNTSISLFYAVRFMAVALMTTSTSAPHKQPLYDVFARLLYESLFDCPFDLNFKSTGLKNGKNRSEHWHCGTVFFNRWFNALHGAFTERHFACRALEPIKEQVNRWTLACQ